MSACRSLIDSCPLLFKSTFTIEDTAGLEMVCSGKRGQGAHFLEGRLESTLLLGLLDGYSLGDLGDFLPGLFHRRHFRHISEYMESITT